MRRLALALAIVSALILPSRADAWLAQGVATVDTGKQLLISGSDGTVSTSADRFIPIGYATVATSADAAMFKFPVAGNIKSLKFRALTQPTGTATFTATIQINGSPISATCSVSVSVQTCDWTGTVAISAGDYGDIKIHPANTPAVAPIVTASVGFTPTTPNDTIISAAAVGGTFSTTVTQVLRMFDGVTPQTAGTGNRNSILPDSGTVDKLHVSSVAPGAAASGKSEAYTLLKNNSAQTLTATITETATSASDTTHTVSVAQGDWLQFQGAPTGTPTASNAVIGVRYVPSTAAHYAYITGIGSVAVGDRFTQLANGSGGNATETLVQGVTHPETFKVICAKSSAAPGAGGSGKKYRLTLRVNGADSSGTVDIVETATSACATINVAANDNDLVDIRQANIGATAGGSLGIALLATR